MIKSAILPKSDPPMLHKKWHQRRHRLAYYAGHILADAIPRGWWQKTIDDARRAIAALPDDIQAQMHAHADIANRLREPFTLPPDAAQIGTFRDKSASAYYYDLAPLLRYFPADYRFLYEYGDVIHVPAAPAFVKSRPISDDNAAAVILKLDSVRHFYLHRDPLPFVAKKAQLVWRGAAHQPHRLAFLQRYHSHPRLDVGCVHRKSEGTPYHRPYLSVAEQLHYRYILSIEGNDVATNLKWILASQSLCFMTRPRYETWLLESRLQAGVHYVELADDYHDIDEKLDYYERHPDAAQTIIANANAYMQPFRDRKRETLCQLLVMQRYFSLSGQME